MRANVPNQRCGLRFALVGGAVFALIAISVAIACGGGGKKFERPIPEALTATAGSVDVSIGVLDTDKTAVVIPAGTFGSDTEVTLVSPTEVPGISRSQGALFGAAFELSAGDRPTRLQHLVTVTVAFDPASIPEGTDAAFLKAAYFNGETWKFFQPDAVDLSAGTLSFTTDHFTLFGTAKISIEEVIERHAHSETLADNAQAALDDKIDGIMEEAIDNLLKDTLKLAPESYKSKILGSLLKDDEYREALEAAQKGDFGEYAEKINALVGETLVKELPKSDLIEALKGLGDEEKDGEGFIEEVGEIVKVSSQAAGALAAGDTRGAARYIGEAIAGRFAATAAIKIAVELTQFEIDSWRDDKVEAAYEAYRDGKESDSYRGYSVDKGNFDAVWNQMLAVGERLQLEAIEKEEEIRREGNAPPLSERETDIIRGKVKTELRAMFERRAQEEAQIAQSDAKNEKLLKAFQQAHLLEEGSFRYSSDKYDIDTRIESLLRIHEQILGDLEGNPKGRVPTDGDIASLAQALLSGTSAEGRKLYVEKLNKDFGVEVESALAEGGLGIQGDFTLVPLPDPLSTNDAQMIMFNALTTAAKIEVKDKSFDVSYSQDFSDVGAQRAQGNGWTNLTGTYDPGTAMLAVQYEIGWDVIQDAFGEKDSKERVVYSGNSTVKITPSDKTVLIDYMGTTTVTRSNRRIDGWTKPFTVTDPGGPGVHYTLEIK